MSGGVARATLRDMTNFPPPPAEELRRLDAELRVLDARRAVLLRRREWLVHLLRTGAASQPGSAPARPVGAGRVEDRPEATAPGVQNVLLVLGGILLTVAATAFTLVSWGQLGIGGRAAVLGAVTAGALAAPVALLRRGLRSTAEAVAGLGMALTVLDAYALYTVAFAGADALAYTAAACAVLAGAWAAYGAGVERGPARKGGGSALRLPLPLAVVAGQLPLLLWVVSAGAGPYTVSAVLLATAAADAVLALRATLVPVRVVAVVGGCGTGAVGVLAAGWLCWSAAGPGTAGRAALLLVVAAALALAVARWTPRADVATGGALVAGLSLIGGAGGVLRASAPGEWTAPGCLACAIALLVAVIRTGWPEPVRKGLIGASLTVQGVTVLWALPLAAGLLLGPLTVVERVWSGAPRDMRDAVFADVPWPAYADTVPLVLAGVAGVLAVAARRALWGPASAVGALVLGGVAVLAGPVVLHLPYPAGLVVQGVLVACALAVADRMNRSSAPGSSHLALTAVLLAFVTSVGLALLSLAAESATLAVLAGLAVLFGAVSLRPGSARLAAPASLAYAAALACAVGASAGWPLSHTALLVLVVPSVAALVAARLGDSPATVPVECAGAGAGLLASALTVTDLPMLALVLSLGGVITAGTALRPSRRWVGYVATCLLLLATWVRLVAWEVTAPEAYTVPVAVPALVVGYLRRRRDPAVSSWTAYGAGLAVPMVPSLLAAWADPHWLRPLLLGLAALAVTLVGARSRLRAPLLLGGGVLALVALHELAPYLAQVVGALPRWVAPALAGLLLLAAGATYEQRLRDARRVREALGRLR